MLVELLLEELAADYAAYRADVPLVVAADSQSRAANRTLADRCRRPGRAGKRLAAWDAYLRLADFTAEEPAYLRIDDHYTVRSDRWISGRLAAMWSAASADERKAIAEKVAARRPALDKSAHRRRTAALPGPPRRTAGRRTTCARAGQLPRRTRSTARSRNRTAATGRPRPIAQTQAAATELMAKLDRQVGPAERADRHVDGRADTSTPN